jgi:hypothetical protein
VIALLLAALTTVNDLGSPKWPVREAAMRRMYAAGPAGYAVATLNRWHPDVEVRARCRLVAGDYGPAVIVQHRIVIGVMLQWPDDASFVSEQDETAEGVMVYPTRNLPADAAEWFEGYAAEYPATVPEVLREAAKAAGLDYTKSPWLSNYGPKYLLNAIRAEVRGECKAYRRKL